MQDDFTVHCIAATDASVRNVETVKSTSAMEKEGGRGKESKPTAKLLIQTHVTRQM